jgi:putative phosphoesterase
MRAAALSDIHGNLPALEAVLAEVEAEPPDAVVFCGDVAMGPLPRETIERVRAIPNARFVRGNADREIFAPDPAAPVPPEWREWVDSQVDAAQRDFLASFEDTVELDVDGLGRVLFCHGTPSSDIDMMTALTPEERLRGFLTGVEADVVVCGHTHMQFDRVVDGIRVVNCGSVGMPYGGTGAFWALLGPDLGLRRTAYDLGAAAERLRSSGFSRIEEFIAENVLTTPSAEEVLAAFAAADGR